MESSTHIKCPKCGESIVVEDIIAHQLRDEFNSRFKIEVAKREEKITEEFQKKEQTYQQQLAKQKDEFSGKEKAIIEKEEQLRQERNDLDKQIQEKLKEREEKQLIDLRKKVEEENAAKIKFLEQEKEEGVRNTVLLREAEFEKLKLQKRIDVINEEKELEFARRMEERMKQESEAMVKRANETSELKIKEKELKIEELANKIHELQRKVEQGSMQAQGEAQEIALEEALRSLFVYDTIDEVGKGVKGADVVQIVRNQFGQECGKILYESKRTKHFSYEWVDKLNKDNIVVNAKICVIVTETMPAEIKKIGQHKGVWICSYSDFKGLAMVLRESLILISEAYASQTDKGGKMQMLYDYLTGSEFKQITLTMLDGFNALTDSLNKERQWMERQWKSREKQLLQLQLNTQGFLGSIQGIAGSMMPEIQELGAPEFLLEEGDETSDDE